MGQVIYPEQFQKDNLFVCNVPHGVDVKACHATPMGVFFSTNKGLMAPINGTLEIVESVFMNTSKVNEWDIFTDNVTPMDKT